MNRYLPWLLLPLLSACSGSSAGRTSTAPGDASRTQGAPEITADCKSVLQVTNLSSKRLYVWVEGEDFCGDKALGVAVDPSRAGGVAIFLGLHRSGDIKIQLSHDPDAVTDMSNDWITIKQTLPEHHFGSLMLSGEDGRKSDWNEDVSLDDGVASPRAVPKPLRWMSMLRIKNKTTGCVRILLDGDEIDGMGVDPGGSWDFVIFPGKHLIGAQDLFGKDIGDPTTTSDFQRGAVIERILAPGR